jgi:hypothetical protein
MQFRYLSMAILAFSLSFGFRAIAVELNPVIKPCLIANASYTTPAQYRQFAQVKHKGTTYYYLYDLINPKSFPDGAVLIKSQNGKCDRVGNRFIGLFQDISKFVPRNVAIALTEAKWRSLLKFKEGPGFLKSVTSSKDVTSKNGELLPPVALSSLDRQVLQKLGHLR